MDTEFKTKFEELSELMSKWFDDHGITPEEWLKRESLYHNRHDHLSLIKDNNLPKHIYDAIVAEADISGGVVTEKMEVIFSNYYKDIQTPPPQH